MIGYVLTDAHLSQIEPLCLGKKSAPGQTGWDGRFFSKQFCRSPAPAVPGVIFLGIWATGIRCSSVSSTWPNEMCSSGFWMCYQRIWTSNTRWSMPLPFTSTVTRTALNGDSKSGHRKVQWRVDDQDPCPDRRTRKSCSLRLSARQPVLLRGCRIADRGHGVRGAAGRQSISQQLGHLRHERARRKARYLAKGAAQSTASPSTRKSTNGYTSSRTISAYSKSSSVLPAAMTRPTQAPAP